MTSKEYTTALNLFNESKYAEAAKLFDELGFLYESGYGEFAQGNLDKAKYIWKASKIDSPAIEWGNCIIQLINRTIPIKISYFQIRNFLERDLDVLLCSDLMDYADRVLSAEKILFKYNPETYKFMGRGLMAFGFFDLAYEFLLKAQNVCYTDVEVQFLIAQYFICKLDRESGAAVLKKLIKNAPDYYPAQKLLESISYPYS